MLYKLPSLPAKHIDTWPYPSVWWNTVCALVFAWNYPARIHHSCHQSRLCNFSSCGKTPVYHFGVWGKPAERKRSRNKWFEILMISDNDHFYIQGFSKQDWYYRATAEYRLKDIKAAVFFFSCPLRSCKHNIDTLSPYTVIMANSFLLTHSADTEQVTPRHHYT